MDVAMRINPQDKMINGERMEKWVVRKAFEDMLPESVAWRQKEQFSDGVGYSWIDTLKEVVNEEVTDEQLANAKFRFPLQTPHRRKSSIIVRFLKNIFHRMLRHCACHKNLRWPVVPKLPWSGMRLLKT